MANEIDTSQNSMATSNTEFCDEAPRIYHENQQAALCGVHSLNNLFQGPYFTEVDLATIATKLDQQERDLLYAQNTGNLGNFVSSNVDESGNFSFSVLRKAVGDSHDIDLVSISVDEILTTATNEQGFLIHRGNHWRVYRKLYGMFWDLDSLRDMPVPISATHMVELLFELHEKGCAIFAVRGSLPQPISALIEGDGICYSLDFLLQTAYSPDTQQSESFVANGANDASLDEDTGASEQIDDDLMQAILLSCETGQQCQESTYSPVCADSSA